MLSWGKPNPGCELSTGLELPGVTYRGDNGGRRNRAYAGNSRQPLTCRTTAVSRFERCFKFLNSGL